MNLENHTSHKVPTGLVCEGGGMRGIYVAGVLDVFGEHGLTFDGVVGVSAGAVHASSFLAGQHGRSIRFYLAYCRDRRFMGWGSWLKTGDFVGAQFCYDDLPNRLVPFDYDALESNPTAFYMATTDVETGKPYYHRVKTIRGEEIKAMRASASLPIASKIVEFQGKMLLDGGTADSIPVEFLRDQGYRRTVVVLTQVAGYQKKPEMNVVFRMMYRHYPDFLKTVEHRHECYNATLAQIEALEKAGEIFVFRPSQKIKIKRLERDSGRIIDMYELGRRDALERLEALKAFLAQ